MPDIEVMLAILEAMSADQAGAPAGGPATNAT
jgi:hypothetical protein